MDKLPGIIDQFPIGAIEIPDVELNSSEIATPLLHRPAKKNLRCRWPRQALIKY